jgi:hypothetical protein
MLVELAGITTIVVRKLWPTLRRKESEDGTGLTTTKLRRAVQSVVTVSIPRHYTLTI